MPGATPSLGLGPVARIILYSSHFERDVAWYREVLGLQLAYPAEHGWAEFASTGAGALCLHEGRAQAGPIAGQATVGWRVEQLDGALAHLRSHGTAVGDPRPVCEGTRCLEFADPSGNSLFLEGP